MKEAMKLALEALEKQSLHELAAASLSEGLSLDDWAKISCVNHDCDKCKALAEQPAPVQQCMDHGECFGGKCIYPAPQPPAQQEPVGMVRELFTQTAWEKLDVVGSTKVYLAAPQPAQRKPQFKEFTKWAGAQGYDCAQTCNSDTGEWICLNPMTADLWKAWQAAHGIKEQP